MAKPIEPTPKLEGNDALNFLKEKERIESLKPSDREYKERQKFFKECITKAKKVKWVM
jgi:hypothetical protein